MAILFQDEKHPAFNFLGVTEFSGYEMTTGFASGIFHRDVKKEWGHCFNVVPVIVANLSTIFTKIISLFAKPDPIKSIEIAMNVFSLLTGFF